MSNAIGSRYKTVGGGMFSGGEPRFGPCTSRTCETLDQQRKAMQLDSNTFFCSIDKDRMIGVDQERNIQTESVLRPAEPHADSLPWLCLTTDNIERSIKSNAHSSLMSAIDARDLDSVKVAVIRLGANVNQTAYMTEETPLMKACYLFSLPIVQFLLDNGAQPTVKCLDSLVSNVTIASVNDQRTEAAASIRPQIAAALFSSSALDDGPPALDWRSNSRSILALLTALDDGGKMVEFCTAPGSPMGALADEELATMFFNACGWGSLAAVQQLLNTGRDVGLNRATRRVTPFQAACRSGRYETARWLLMRAGAIGMDVRTTIDGNVAMSLRQQTALDCCLLAKSIHSGHETTAQLLLEHGFPCHRDSVNQFKSNFDTRRRQYPEELIDQLEKRMTK